MSDEDAFHPRLAQDEWGGLFLWTGFALLLVLDWIPQCKHFSAVVNVLGWASGMRFS